MVTVKKRPSSVSFKCPYSTCGNTIGIYPVSHKYYNKTYEAWAIIWFDMATIRSAKFEKTKRHNCILIYDGKICEPIEAARKISKSNVNPWIFWRLEGKEREDRATLHELAVSFVVDQKYK